MAKILGFIVITMVVGVSLLIGIELWNQLVEKKECLEYSKTTGYWVKYDAMNGCFVLIDNQYLVNKDALTASDRPALDPKIVGIDATTQQILEN